jgi:hypothetical protein
MDIRERFFQAGKRRYRDFDAPLIGNVRLRSLTNDEMRTLKESFTDETGKINERGKKLNELLVAACVCDASGDRVFSDDDAMGSLFGEMDGAPLAALVKACIEFTNFRADPDWKAIEDAAKN